ncbi:DUF4140 domain-containing protein [bacterium]|nr:DUF4140 domain-containing protein [bacterium]
MKTFLVAFMLVMSSVSARGAGESVVLFLDGARLEYDVVARQGYLETPLPATMLPNTLRVRPVGACEVLRVEVAHLPRARKAARELAALEERKIVLTDRLKALEQKEEIFRAAAKSQSSRAPRKTKSNPDPLEAVRKGSDFALSRLESVHAVLRKTERECAAVEAKLSALDKDTSSSGVAKVWLSKDNGKARITCLVSDLRWTPYYDFRLSGNGYAETSLRAGIPSKARTGSVAVVPLTLADAGGADIAPTPIHSDLDRIDSFRFALAREELVRGPVSVLSFTFGNTAGKSLPPGEAFAYWKGEYLGKSRFDPCSVNGTRSLEFGR